MEAGPQSSPGKPEDVPLDDADFYVVLGVPHDATDKQITAAYKKLALKYHPDRNLDDSYAHTKYKAIQEAYQTLLDPAKRQLYDSRDENTAPVPPVIENQGVDVAGLGGLGRMFGAVMSRLGNMAITTSVSTDILETAQQICKNGGIEGGGPPLDPRVVDLAWGWPVDGKADKQSGVFYRLTVDAQHREAGFFLHARSQNKDKFKLLIFDKDGSLLFSEDFHKNKTCTYASLFFTTFETYVLPDQPSVPQGAVGVDAIPAALTRLDGLHAGPRALREGQYLVCVYGDNFMSKSSYSLMALRADSQAPQVGAMEETDDQLTELKMSLSQLSTEYSKTKEAYDVACERVRAEGERVDTLLLRREQLYGEFVEHCTAAFAPHHAEIATAAGAPAGVISGSVHKLASNVNLLLQTMQGGSKAEEPASPAATADDSTGASSAPAPVAPAHAPVTNPLNVLASSTFSAASAVSSNAQAATGWLARRFSLGLKGASAEAEQPSEEQQATASAAPTTAEPVIAAESSVAPAAETVVAPTAAPAVPIPVPAALAPAAAPAPAEQQTVAPQPAAEGEYPEQEAQSEEPAAAASEPTA